MKLMAIVAHPDDASIFCGGTLAKHSDRGDEIHITHMTRGEYGGMDEWNQSDLADVREEEAREAGNVLGGGTSFLDFKDGRIEYSLKNRQYVNDEIRKRSPDLILTHSPEDQHPDHRITSKLVSDAFYLASLPLAESDYGPVDPDNLFYFGKETSGFEPSLFVNISEHFGTKETAIRCHESQFDFLKEHGGIDREFDDLLIEVEARAKNYGRRTGVSYAEGFDPLHTVAQEFLG